MHGLPIHIYSDSIKIYIFSKHNVSKARQSFNGKFYFKVTVFKCAKNQEIKKTNVTLFTEILK
jgi:hypothetical protein